MKNIPTSGQATFQIDVPYKLIETGGSSEEKPLIVYLHGFNQNIKQFEKLVTPMLQLNAYHLFVQAPYPIYDRSRKKNVEDWGRSWYLYDGRQEQFIKSLESASVFLEGIIEEVLPKMAAGRVTVFGYSMGGYLGGYVALSRLKLVDELIVIGARIKTEVFEEENKHYDHLKVLALHGRSDKTVQSKPQQESCQQLSQWGAAVTFYEVDSGHRLNDVYLDEVLEWIKS